MRSKRLLATLLALCMVLSVFSPAALAVEAGNDTFLSVAPEAENKTNNTASSKENDLMIAPEQSANHEIPNLRDNPLFDMTISTNNSKGHWEVSPAVKPEVSLTPDAPACLEELKKAAQFYSADEIVKAFVVMEDAPLAESTHSITLASASQQKLLIEKQDSVISAIEKKVLNGQSLNVRYQFTYLTNAFSIETAFANLAQIAVLPGVKEVVIMSTWEAVPTETADPLTAASGPLTGVDNVWADLGYTGEGMKIAIVDTGLDLDHPSFAAAPAGASMDLDDIAAVLEDLNIYKRRGGNLTAEDLYRSEKVPFAFNYCDDNLNADHSRDNQGDHGTHVAGIAAANKVEGTSVVGMAPNAQIIVMKVFGANGGAYTDDFVAAIEDAMTLGCDVVNLSLGSPAGFTYSGYETVDGLLVDEVFARLKTQNIIATISAGNETNSSYDNMWGTDLNRTQNPENGVVGSPSSYVNSFSIASADNSVVMTNYMAMADGTKIFYQPCIEYLYGYVYGFVEMFGGETLEYAIVPGLGAPEDFYDAEGNSIVEGKIAIIKRGELSFAEKIQNAAYAGAVAAIIWNTNDTEDIFTFGMTTEVEPGVYTDIVSAIITLSDGQKLADAETKTLQIAKDLAGRQVQGGQMSSFSSWGTTSDLRLIPDITGVGGNVFSTLDRGQYGVMSGTSMSAPQVAGISALVMQYLHEKFPNAANGEIREMALALMMSTANPVIAKESGVEASPRQQGAGLVNAAEAILANAYLTVNGGRPKAELGDSANGTFSFDFEIHNVGDKAQTYTLDSSLLGEDMVGYMLSETEIATFMAGYDWELEGDVTFSKDQVTVAPGETVTITVSIALSDDQKAFFDYYWENGTYVEGYIYLDNTDDNGIDLNMPFLGFYGDWTDAPVFDTAYWYDNSFFGYTPVNGLPEGDQYYHAFWTDLAGTDWVLGMNPYSGEVLDENGQIIYDPANNALSPNGDGVLDGITEIYLSLLRNAAELSFTYTVDGEVVYQEISYNNSKTMFISNYGQIVPWVGSWYLDSLYYTGMAYDFTDAEGNPLPSGTEVLLTIEAKIDYADGGENVMEIPFIVDTTAPELLEVYEIPQDGSNYLVLDVKDNHNIASVVILNEDGTKILTQQYDIHGEALEDGSDRFYIDVTGLGTKMTVVVCDYACNETYYSIEYTADPEGNLPVMDTSLLYAYRVADPTIEYYMGYDYQFGWVNINKPENDIYGTGTSVIMPESSDYMEAYAINAAEFAGGKIFAIDAGYNFLVVTPGLWDRQIITNLGEGMSALDMAFDDVTDTMYALIKYDYNTFLYAIDLLTGELTLVKDYGYYYYAPYALTADDEGNLYAIKYSNANLYTLDQDNDFAMVAVTVAEGENLVITDANGENVKPNYAQSLTYVDGKIYWAYFYSSWSGVASEMITIDVDNGYAVTNTPYISVYPELGGSAESYTELVGLLTLDPTDYEIPEAEALSGLLMAEEHVVLLVGESTGVAVTPIPWNFELGTLYWSSSDESVATVDANGKITGVGKGTAIITASTEDNFTAEVIVSVADPEGEFYAYNYFSANGYGDFISVALDDMTMSSMFVAPADFLAGDYNGHDNCFYGYTEGGQMFKLDMATGEAISIGSPTGINPTDMAYDYSTGLMYAAYVNDQGLAVLAYADMNTGKLVDVAVDYQYTMMMLACDLEGNLYTITADGMLAKLSVIKYEDWMTGEMVTGLEYEILMTDLGYLQYQQSMCYDHTNDVILWCNPETSVIYWVDFNSEYPYAISLGDPSESGLIEWLGMFTIPAEIPELAPVAVDTVTAEDMFMMVGMEKVPAVNILPLNANDYTTSMVSSDEAVVAIENGMLVAKSEGVATITLTVDDAVSGEQTVVTFEVTTANAADNVYGHILTDLESMAGYLWAEIPVLDPSTPEYVGDTFASLGTSFVVYAEEYYDGKLYVYGYDDSDWTSNFQFMVLDPETFEMLESHDMGAGFPFVYDMTYDYNTSTMYCVAGAGSEASNLYAVNMKNGKLTLIMETEQFFMMLAAGPDGLYAIEHSQTVQDEWDPWAPATTMDANLYLIDPSTMEIEIVGDTGLVCNALGSMAYDYDTDYLYWAVLNQNDYTGGLAIVDPDTGAARVIDSIGALGSQVTGLYIICDEFPAENPQLHELIVNEKALTYVGQTITIDVATLAMNLDAEITFTSSDESVATVDENGVVTAIAKGQTDITVTASFGGVTKTAVCEVAVLTADAAFLTYNTTEGGWALVNRADPSIVTPLTEDENAYPVSALAAVGNTIYGYDIAGELFTLNTATYEREAIGTLDYEALILEFLEFQGMEDDLGNYAVEIRDMAYDAANERMLVLANISDVEWGEMVGSGNIYEVDLTTGELTHLYMIVNNYSVMAMTVDGNGMIYYYNAFDDNYTALDLVNMTETNIVSLQSQTIYGSVDHAHELFYDEYSGNVYHLFTGNGNFYKLLCLNTVTGAVEEIGSVGETVYDEDAWAYFGDSFSGLTYVDGVEFESTVWVNPFDDVDEDDYFFDAVKWAHQNGITSGRTPTHFGTGENVTRAQFVTFLWAANGKPAPETTVNPFTDVDEDDYYYEAVLWAYENGITAGTTATTFSPSNVCTRNQVVTFLWVYMGRPEPGITENPFSDVEEGTYYYKAVLWAYEQHVTAGRSATLFGTHEACTREQAVTFLYKILAD